MDKKTGGQYIRALRRKLGLSQAEFGKRINPTNPPDQTTVSKWETAVQPTINPNEARRMLELARKAKFPLTFDKIYSGD